MKDAAELLKLRTQIVKHYATKGVETEHDLVRFAAGVTGRRWLDRPLCKHHGSPWELISSAFFEEDEVLGVGPRGGFKTQSVGLLNCLEALGKPGIQIVHAAANLRQSGRAHGWSKFYLMSPAVRAAGLTDGGKFHKWKIILPNKSKIEVVPATTDGLNGPHPNKLRLDEYELIKPEVIDEARLIPKSYGGYKRGLVYVSSRKRRNGNVDRLLYDRKYSEMKKVIWCIAEVVEKCPTERHGVEEEIFEGIEDLYDLTAPPLTVKAFKGCGECALLPDCRGQFAKSSGWTSISDTIKEFSTIDAGTWISQMRSRRKTEPRGRVFPKFSHDKNVKDIEPIPGLPIHLVVDFGGGTSSTAVLFWQEIDGVVRVYAEYVEAGTGPEEDVPAVEEILDKLFPGFKIGDSPADSAVPILMQSWNKATTRFNLFPVQKLHTKVDMIANLSALISPAMGSTRYLVHSRCEVHIKQLLDYRHKKRVIKGVTHAAYPDKDDDTVDAAAYLALETSGSAALQPHVYVLDIGTGRVESSGGAPSAGLKLEEMTGQDLLRARLWRLLRRNAD